MTNIILFLVLEEVFFVFLLMHGLQLLHDPEWGNDSTVFRLRDSVIKVYRDSMIVREELQAYHEMHNSFGGESFIFPLEKEVEYWNGRNRQRGYVSQIVTSVLQFPEESIRISNGKLVSIVPYIEGGTGLEFIGGMYNGSSFWYSYIEETLTTRLGTNQLNPRNIKISDIKDGIIYCTVTDLACSIRGLLSGN